MGGLITPSIDGEEFQGESKVRMDDWGDHGHGSTPISLIMAAEDPVVLLFQDIWKILSLIFL